ncbi:hypothetical protein KKA15_01930 [Patescibacteria group bacterium]|nr:hypothetical protein [Patescibacteria group bacterium]
MGKPVMREKVIMEWNFIGRYHHHKSGLIIDQPTALLDDEEQWELLYIWKMTISHFLGEAKLSVQITRRNCQPSQEDLERMASRLGALKDDVEVTKVGTTSRESEVSFKLTNGEHFTATALRVARRVFEILKVGNSLEYYVSGFYEPKKVTFVKEGNEWIPLGTFLRKQRKLPIPLSLDNNAWEQWCPRLGIY